jgi:uncharacterized protein
MAKILNSMDVIYKQTHDNNFCLHGGECTLIDREDFETLLKKMFDLQRHSSLQTNCYLLDDGLIEIFKKYKTSIGVSIDGDGELNILRGYPNDKEKNEAYTKQVIDNMIRLHNEGIGVGVISVLSKANADSDAKLKKLVDFILMLRSHGIKGGRLNLMWSNHEKSKKYELTEDEASHAWLYLYNALKPYRDINWQPFRDFVDNIMGFGHSSCSYGKCDYYCTTTKVILANGNLGNCDRTHQEGYLYERSKFPSNERYDYLKLTDCKDCRYWNVCYGGCPAESVDADWRNKTRFCKATYNVYSAIENDIKDLFPNIELMSDYRDPIDYYDNIRNGIYHDALVKMSRYTSTNPSVWKLVNMRNPNQPHTNTCK